MAKSKPVEIMAPEPVAKDRFPESYALSKWSVLSLIFFGAMLETIAVALVGKDSVFSGTLVFFVAWIVAGAFLDCCWSIWW